MFALNETFLFLLHVFQLRFISQHKLKWHIKDIQNIRSLGIQKMT